MEKSPDAFRTISEAAEELDLPQHVLRFWETRFPNIKPMKRGGGRRYYRPEDVLLLKGIRHLLYDQGFTIKGVQRILKDRGVRNVIAMGEGRPTEPYTPPDMEADEPVPDAAFADDLGENPEPVMPQPEAPERQRIAPPPARSGHALDADDREKLSQVLRELLDCKRLLERAREG